jgi:hypothetical protein
VRKKHFKASILSKEVKSLKKILSNLVGNNFFFVYFLREKEFLLDSANVKIENILLRKKVEIDAL